MAETPAERLEAARDRLRENARPVEDPDAPEHRSRGPRAAAAGVLRRLAGRLEPRSERPGRRP